MSIPIPSPRKSAASLKEVFAKNLIATRKLRGLTQEELAHRAGLHRTAIGHLERATRNATLETIEVLCDALEVPATTLVQRDGQ